MVEPWNTTTFVWGRLPRETHGAAFDSDQRRFRWRSSIGRPELWIREHVWYQMLGMFHEADRRSSKRDGCGDYEIWGGSITTGTGAS